MTTTINGSIIVDESTKPIIEPLRELKNLFFRFFYDFIGFFILLFGLPILFVINKLFPIKDKRVMIGTVPLVTNIHIKQLFKRLLKDYGEVEIFVFQDWLNETSYYDITTYDILPRWLIGKNPYGIAPYLILLWSYRRYKVFYWYLNSAILERTIFWRIEPILMNIFNKKLIMRGYGSDQWSLLQTNNLNFKFGLMVHRKRYFMMDFKRIKRMYMWAKYSNIFNGDIRYVPRIASFGLSSLYIDLDELQYNINTNTNPIIISHYSNHSERKGSMAIKEICEELKSEGYNIKFISVSGVSRKKALSILENSHIFISNIMHGVIDTAVLEALATGNVVFTHLDKQLIELALIQNYKFYKTFFEISPIINIDVFTLKQELIKYITNKELLLKQIKYSRKFIEERVNLIQEGYGNHNKEHYVIKLLEEAN